MSNINVPQQEVPNQPVENQPAMGLYLDRPSQQIDPRGLEACNNVRIEMGRYRADLMGWSTFAGPLNGPVDLITTFQLTTGPELLIFGTPTDLYSWNGGVPVYITPVYNAGTVAVTNNSTTVTGTGTFWNTPIGGNFTSTASAAAPFGATAIVLGLIPPGLTVGELIADTSNPAAIVTGTLVSGIVGNTILLSQPLAFNLASGDTIQFGGQLANFRKNVRAGDYIFVGSAAQNATAPTGGWYEVASVASNTSLTLTAAYSGTNASDQAYTARQCATNWAAASSPFGPWVGHWESETFPQAGTPWNKDMWFATNGQDPLIGWDGTALFAQYVTTVPFISTTLRRFKNLMIYGGLTGQNGQLLPTSIANSDNSTPTVMAGGVAFQGVVTDGPFIMNHIGILGNSLMLYMGGPMGGVVTAAQFMGAPFIWSFSDVVKGRGAITGRMVAEFPDRHQFVAQDGMYRYNGIFIQIMNDQVWRALLKNIDMSRADRAFHTINKTYGDLHWAIPLQSDANLPGLTTAYTEAYMEQPNSFLFKPYTQRDFPFTSAGIWPNVAGWTFNGMTGAWSADPRPFNVVTVPVTVPVHLAGDEAGNIWKLYTTTGLQGTLGFASWLRYPKKLLGNGARGRALVKRVYPFIETAGTSGYTVQVTLSMFDSVAGPVKINDSQQFDPTYTADANGIVYHYTKHFRRGRVAQVTIGTDGCTGGEPFIIDGVDFDWIGGGLR